MSKKIAFFYPSLNIGGAQLLFARLAVQLISIGQDVIIIDLKEGFISSYIKGEGFKPTLKIYDGNTLSIDEDVCLIQHLSHIRVVKTRLSLTTKSTFVFWSIHPHNVLALLNLTPLYTRASYYFSKLISGFLEPRKKARIKRLLKEMADKNALYYMDESNYRPSSEIGLLTQHVNYLPIPIITKTRVKNRTDFLCTNFAWIGRITGEKIQPFNRIIKELDNYSGNQKIRFHIIGYGNLNALRKVHNLEIINHGIVSKTDLDNLLLSGIDCVFAMGTSILESSVLSIPSVLCDISKRTFPTNYKYKFVFDTENFSLGTEARRATGTLTIEEIIDLMSTRETYEDLATKCKVYAEENHGITKITNKILLAAKKSTFDVSSLRSYY